MKNIHCVVVDNKIVYATEARKDATEWVDTFKKFNDPKRVRIESTSLRTSKQMEAESQSILTTP